MENLEIFGVYKKYGDVNVLQDINIRILEGNICVLLGPSGSGKSTLLNLIGGIERYDKGTITFSGSDTSKLTEKDLTIYRRNNLGFVFQFYNLIPNLTVKENIEVAADISTNSLDIDEIIDTLGLKNHQNKFPNELSGGQQQRCAIGRALVKNPKLLLCDEPTGALDSKTSREILMLIEKIHEKYKNTIIIVTHNEPIRLMANQIIRLHDGKVVYDKRNSRVVKAKDIEL